MPEDCEPSQVRHVQLTFYKHLVDDKQIVLAKGNKWLEPSLADNRTAWEYRLKNQQEEVLKCLPLTVCVPPQIPTLKPNPSVMLFGDGDSGGD